MLLESRPGTLDARCTQINASRGTDDLEGAHRQRFVFVMGDQVPPARRRLPVWTSRGADWRVTHLQLRVAVRDRKGL
jgi:hypothetical protein